MMTALACREQSAFYMDEAKVEADTGIRTTLLNLQRSLNAIANQIDRLAELRAVKG